MDYQYKILNIETSETGAFNIIAIVNKAGYERVLFHFNDVTIEPDIRNPAQLKINFTGSAEVPESIENVDTLGIETVGDDLFKKILKDVFDAYNLGIPPEKFLETH